MLRGIIRGSKIDSRLSHLPHKLTAQHAAARRFMSFQQSSNKPKEKIFGVFRFITAFGGVVLTLSTQNLAQEIAGGIAIMMHQDLVAVGDEVKLYDGTDGYIHRLGWVSSTIRGLDDIYIQIPNSHLLHKPLTNISRAKRCQVKQILRFKYSDLDHIPTILEEIQSRVTETCPKLITKGTPYRAVICSYETDHVQAMVNFHFEIPSQTEAFYRNRQEVLVVIGSVMKEHGVEFALPVMETTQN